MLYSVEKQFLFSQTPRSASTSTVHFLQPYCCPPGTAIRPSTPELVTEFGIVGQRGPKTDGATFRVHMPLSEIKAAISDEIWDACLKIANVRNPFAQIVSIFTRRVRLGHFGSLTTFDALRAQFQRVFRVRRDLKSSFFVGSQFAIDLVVVYETIGACIAKLKQRLNIPEETPFPHEQRTRNQLLGHDVSEMYGQDQVDIVLEQRRWVFERFGYSTDPRDWEKAPAS